MVHNDFLDRQNFCLMIALLYLPFPLKPLFFGGSEVTASPKGELCSHLLSFEGT